jgi:hypothetical protein
LLDCPGRGRMLTATVPHWSQICAS